jgi:hypothetical protein
MIRYVLYVLLFVIVGIGVPAVAADLPLSNGTDHIKRVKTTVPGKKLLKTKRKVAAVPRPAKLKVAKLAATETTKPDAAPQPDKINRNPDQELELSWFLDSLVANADGPKGEGSASLEGNLIIAEPGVITSPYMVIELSGHIIKTPATTVRLDIQIGSVQKTVSWASDEVKSGRFSVTLNAPMRAGQLPGYFPVSALAFVTREGKQGAAMVSLEKVQVRVGKIAQVATN